MTLKEKLKELKERCENAGFKYAYGRFKNATEPPHLVSIITDTDNFFADNKTYYTQVPIKLDYTYVDKDLDEQEKIENEILSDVAWDKTEETYLEDQEVWQVSYFFEI